MRLKELSTCSSKTLRVFSISLTPRQTQSVGQKSSQGTGASSQLIKKQDRERNLDSEMRTWPCAQQKVTETSPPTPRPPPCGSPAPGADQLPSLCAPGLCWVQGMASSLQQARGGGDMTAQASIFPSTVALNYLNSNCRISLSVSLAGAGAHEEHTPSIFWLYIHNILQGTWDNKYLVNE